MKATIFGMNEAIAGFAARLLLHGWTVHVCNASAKDRELLAIIHSMARRSLPALRDFSIPVEGELVLEEGSSVEPCDLVLCAAGASARGFDASPGRDIPVAVVCDADLRVEAASPITVHVMKPSYLLPLAEVCGAGNKAGTVARFLEMAGMKAVETGANGPYLNRILMHGGADEVPAQLLNDMLMHGPGLALAARGAADPAEPRSRDDALVAVLRALKNRDTGAGHVLRANDTRPPLPEDWSQPLKTLERVIPIDWTDYNGHMNESRYGHVFSDAGDTVMMMVGADQAYIDAGRSYFTVYNNITYLAETNAGDAIEVRTQVLQAEGKKLRMHHEMRHLDGRLLATCTQLLIHVSLETRRSCEPESQVLEKLERMQEMQSRLPRPDSLKE
ncbi:MAG: thioesterase family protein [Nitratireductor sp.]|nr:thioesterase family protein [Nitratireductor sp.]